MILRIELAPRRGTMVSRMNSASSFFRFVLGFLTFISLSFALTYAVGTYTVAQEKEAQAAAALQALLGEK